MHDVGESRTGDTNYLQAVYTTKETARAVRDTFSNTTLVDLYSDILKEYDARKTLAAKIVKDADNLDVDIELKEMEERGSLIAKKMMSSRKIIRKQKLYTKTGKRIWDEIQKADPSAWHLAANKWVKMKNAGRLS